MEIKTMVLNQSIVMVLVALEVWVVGLEVKLEDLEVKLEDLEVKLEDLGVWVVEIVFSETTTMLIKMLTVMEKEVNFENKAFKRLL
jgi:hypothetical protein